MEQWMYLESCWTPIHKLDTPLGFDSCNGGVHVLRNNISSEDRKILCFRKFS